MYTYQPLASDYIKCLNGPFKMVWSDCSLRCYGIRYNGFRVGYWEFHGYGAEKGLKRKEYYLS